MDNKYKPFLNIGPGDLIRDELEYYGWTQKDLADILDVTEKHVSKLLKNESSITLEMSRRLSKTFKQSPQFWMNADANYRLRLDEETEAEKIIAEKSFIYQYMPYNEMVKKGWLKKTNNFAELKEHVLNFWQISDLNFDFLSNIEAPCFRKSSAFQKFNAHAAAAWFQKVKNSANPTSTPPFNKSALQQLAGNLSSFTTRQKGVQEFLSELQMCGVTFLVLSHLTKTYIDGASFWQKSHPVIVYTIRYNKIDNFWFTMAHELGHTLLHDGDKKSVFIDCLDNINSKDPKERQADEFAQQNLCTDRAIEFFKGYQRIPEYRIREYAEVYKIHPAVIVGALQHKKLLPHNRLNEVMEKVAHRIPKHNYVEAEFYKIRSQEAD